MGEEYDRAEEEKINSVVVSLTPIGQTFLKGRRRMEDEEEMLDSWVMMTTNRTITQA
jgi:hypothetical protein